MLESKHQFNLAADYVGYANIKVVGVGGGGGNAINRMIQNNLRGVEFIAINTDAQVLDQSMSEKKIQIGREITNGLGAGANPDVGRKAVEESRAEVMREIGTPNLVFITAGMGGGTGTGAAPAVAELAKLSGALTVAIVTTPFRFEGKQRMNRAESGLAELKSKVDTLITIPNERLLSIVDKKTTLSDAFATADEVLHQATKGISDLITIPGLINCDFADVRTVMREMGDALMGTGSGKGEDKASEAAREAISSPLLGDVSIRGARGVLINVTGGEDMTLFDVNTATSLIYEEAGDSANIIFGAVIDPTMNDEMQVTVIATGLGEEMPKAKPVLVEEKKPEPVRPVAQAVPAEEMSLFTQPTVNQPIEQVAPPAPVVPPAPKAPMAPPAQPVFDAPNYYAPFADEGVTGPVEEVEEEMATVSPSVPEYTPESGNGNGHGNGNGNGHANGNGHSNKYRVPNFSEDDRTIPAYLRRLRGQR
ncbi:MAG: cell division protein FtsZ [bacterium]|nr:cell division protein FtsZ [bacterium]